MSTRDYTILLKVRADLQDALGKIGGFDKSVDHLKGTVLGLAGALGIGFSVAGLVDFVKSVVDADQQVGNMAKTLGTSTEQLSALQAEAKKSGVEVDALQASMVALSRSATGQNAQGSAALKAMGISAKDAQGNLKPLPDLLQEVSNKFSNYQDGTGKAALATALFGRAGAQLIPLLDQIGNEGLDNITQKAVDAGTAISEDAVKASNDFANALDDLKAKLQGAVNEGLEQFTPQIETLAEKVDDPQFQKALLDTADGIVAITTAAANRISDLAKFISQMQELAGFSLDGHVGGEGSNAFNNAELDAFTAEQRQRQNEGFLAGRLRRNNAQTEGFLADSPYGMSAALLTGNNPFENGIDKGLAAKAAGMSDADLAANIARLTAERNAYESDQKAADAAAQAKAQAAAAGLLPTDDSGVALGAGFIGGGAKRQAPVLPTAADQARAKAMAAALQTLQDELASLRTQGLDPTAAAWAKYNKTVDDAVAEAAKAGNTPKAQAVLADIVEQAARIRDADIADIVQKDQKAWEEFKASLGGPVDVHLESAIAQLDKLTAALSDPNLKISAEQYQELLGKIFDAAQGGGLHSLRDSGSNGVDQKAQAELDAFQAQQKILQGVRDQALADAKGDQQRELDAQQEYNDRSEELARTHAENMAIIQREQAQFALGAAVSGFGALAQAASSAYGEQSRQARIAFGLQKAAALAQAFLAIQESIANSAKIGFPWNIITIAGAIAQGVSILANIRSASFSDGGYTGPGGKYQPAGIVHAGEGVLNQQEIGQLGGPSGFHALRGAIADGTLALPGYADGGFVSPFANAPTPAQLGFASPRAPRVDFDDSTRGANAKPSVALRIVNQIDQQTTLDHVASAEGEQVVMNIISRNQTKVRQLVK